MPRRKRKINWGAVAAVIQIAVGLIEIGLIVTQCICGDEEEEANTNPEP